MAASSPNVDWLCIALGWPLAVLGVLFLLWSLLPDRSRGRRRCPRCWYSMDGTPGLTCPECGGTARHERALHRTRRRHRAAAVAVLIMMTGVAVAGIPAWRGGWLKAVPSWLLVRIAEPREPTPRRWTGRAPSEPAPFLESYRAGALKEAMAQEAWSRLENDQLSPAQVRCFVTRCISHDVIHVPSVWPVGEPIPYWRSLGSHLGTLLTPVQVRTPSADNAWHPAWSQGQGQIPASNQPRRSLEVDLRFLTNQGGPLLKAFARPAPSPPSLDDEIKQSICATITFPIHIRGTRDDFLDHVDTPEDNARVRDAIAPRLTRAADGRLLFTWSGRSGAPWELINFVVEFRAEILVGDLVCGRSAGAEWEMHSSREWEAMKIDWEHNGQSLVEAALADPSPTTPVHLCVRGAADLASHTYLANPFPFVDPFAYGPFVSRRTSCWTGSFDVPARLVIIYSDPEGTRTAIPDERPAPDVQPK